ncbi:MAG: hypothetical protein IKG53_10025 [Solobacterium sp.]|nr:hypothetical protein [Solobacterium sp.]
MFMNSEYQTEEYFVSIYIKKAHRERLRHELTSEKKRSRGLSRFAHQSSVLLNPARISMKDDNLENLNAFREFVMAHPEVCAILSEDPAIDGKRMPFTEAVSIAAFSPDAVIIIGDSFCAVFAEAEKGGREKYLLAE